VRYLVGCGVLLVALTACSAGESDESSAQATAASTPEASLPAEETEAPATTSGPLTESDLPAPQDLGSDWEPYSDPGGHGYRGNGSFVRERDPHELAAGLVPLGCAGVRQAPGLPVPEHALEATFRDSEGRAAVALVLEYADETAATALVEQLGGLLSSCPDPGAEVDRPTLVVDLLRPDPTTIQSVRREVGPGAGKEVWSEVVVRDGRRVGLTIVQKPDVDFDDLTSRLRAAVG